MKRKLPKLTPDQALAAWDAAPAVAPEWELSLDCKLITPMYGGGVAPGEVDCEMPIRASAIRGQLRFWWRLLNGSGMRSPELFQEECELFGGVAKAGPVASPVTIQVESGAAAAPVAKRTLEKDIRIPPYAFMDPSANPPLQKHGHRWTLLVDGSRLDADRRSQLLDAIRWWASFGGVGARTRRGLGAVRVHDAGIAPVMPGEIERLGGLLVSGRGEANAIKAWNDSVQTLAKFRQLPDGRASGTGGRPGRSRWPEADTIRALGRHRAKRDSDKHPAHDYYPRAAFGLPIVFQRDPKGTLNPADHERMASPLILRPYFDGAGYCPAALLLPGWEQRLKIKARFETHPAPVWPEPERERRAAARFAPVKGRGDNPLTAFMSYFKERFG